MNRPSRWLGAGLIVVGLSLVVVGLVLVLGEGDDSVATESPAPGGSSPAPTVVPSTTAPPATTAPGVTIATPATTAAPTTMTAAPTTTTTAPTTTTVEPASLVVPFFDELSAALRAGDDTFLFATLHPLVFERYAEADCRTYLAGLAVPAYVVQATAVGQAETWEWETDGVVRPIGDAIPVTIRTAPDGANFTDGEAHVVVDDGAVRWFTDCGTPKEGAR